MEKGKGVFMKNKIQMALMSAFLLAFIPAAFAETQLPTLPTKPELPTKIGAPTESEAPTSPAAPTSPVAAVTSGPNPSPELVGQLTKGLGVSQDQAVGGAGALFGLAKSRLKPEEFGKVSSAVPGMDGLLAAAPHSSLGAASPLGSIGSALPGVAGGLAPVAESRRTWLPSSCRF